MSRSASKTFAAITDLLHRLGLLNSEFVLELSGETFKVRSDENTFMIYRTHLNCGPRSHVPGWPVCVVTRDSIFEECASSGAPDDCFNCGISLERWIEIIEEKHRPEP